jgi:hypothetical protein
MRNRTAENSKKDIERVWNIASTTNIDNETPKDDFEKLDCDNLNAGNCKDDMEEADVNFDTEEPRHFDMEEDEETQAIENKEDDFDKSGFPKFKGSKQKPKGLPPIEETKIDESEEEV